MSFERDSQGWSMSQMSCESKDIEEESGNSFAINSANTSRKLKKKKRLSDSSKFDGKTSNYTKDTVPNAKSKTDIDSKVESHSKDSETLSADVYGDSDVNISGNNKNRKTRRKSESNSYPYARYSESSMDKDIVKKKPRKANKQEKVPELPISEILKKNYDQHIKYREPITLPDLSTDTIYIQGKHGFSAKKIDRNDKRTQKISKTAPNSSNLRLINIAIVIQQIWRSLGLFFQGMLGGLSLLHIILMQSLLDRFNQFAINYALISEIYTSIFSLLISICIISTFDRIDLVQIKLERIHIFKQYFNSILAVAFYIIAFSLQQVTIKVNDKLALIHYDCSNVTDNFTISDNETYNGIAVDDFKTWKKIMLLSDVFAVLGWSSVSISTSKDMLLEHLQHMSEFADGMVDS